MPTPFIKALCSDDAPVVAGGEVLDCCENAFAGNKHNAEKEQASSQPIRFKTDGLWRVVGTVEGTVETVPVTSEAVDDLEMN